MILIIIGAVTAYICAMQNQLGPALVGLVVLIFGLFWTSAVSEMNRARGNRRRYWAYGDDPDWKDR